MVRRVKALESRMSGPDNSELDSRLRSDPEMQRLSDDLAASLRMPLDHWLRLPDGQREGLGQDALDLMRRLMVRSRELGG